MTIRSLLVANDAGGANALLSLLEDEQNYQAYATGPSAKVLSNIKNVTLVDDFELLDFSEIYIATSWSDKKWLELVIVCMNRQIKHFVVMDHWVNFEERFYYLNEKINPRDLITLDSFATEIAKNVFPNSNISQRKNLNLERVKLAVENKRKIILQTNVLFIGEYTDYFIADCGMYYEQKLFERLCKYIFQNDPSVNLVLRPHPSEETDKYNFCKSILPFQISECSLEDDLAKASLVLGHDSHALFVAYECKLDCKRVRLSAYEMNYSLPIHLPSLLLD